MWVVVGYTMDTMYFTWLDNPVDVDKDLQLPQFFLVSTPKLDCSQNYTAGRQQITSAHLSLSPVHHDHVSSVVFCRVYYLVKTARQCITEILNRCLGYIGDILSSYC